VATPAISEIRTVISGKSSGTPDWNPRSRATFECRVILRNEGSRVHPTTLGARRDSASSPAGSE
jgi:hypothetical protein